MKNFISLIFLTFTFFVYSQETASPVADDTSFSINEGDTTSSTLTGSDSDSDPENLTFAVVGNPTSGTLTVDSNGSFTYVHSGGEGTSDSFTYSISDETNNTRNIRIFFINYIL